MLPIQIRPIRVMALVLAICAGCCFHKPTVYDVPNEATKVTQQPYTIEAPDILLINAGNLVPLPPYRIGALDILSIKGLFGAKKVDIFEKEVASGLFSVNPEGKVDLGPFGIVSVLNLTLEEAKKTVQATLERRLKKEELSVTVDLAQSNQCSAANPRRTSGAA